jgi:hypothetical protein
MIVSCLAANGAVICSPKKSSTDCKAHWDICKMRYIRSPIIIIIYLLIYKFHLRPEMTSIETKQSSEYCSHCKYLIYLFSLAVNNLLDCNFSHVGPTKSVSLVAWKPMGHSWMHVVDIWVGGSLYRYQPFSHLLQEGGQRGPGHSLQWGRS